MNKYIKTTLFAGVATLLLAGSDVLAQQQGGGQRGQRGQRGQGGGDPAEMRQRMEEFRERAQQQMKESFGVTDDAEWKVISGRLQKVQEAQRELGQFTSRGGMFGMARRPGGGAAGAGGGDTERARGGGPGGMFGGTPNAAMEALQKALDDGASADVIKTKIAAVREARKAAEDKVVKAQADLQKVLSVKQEGRALALGLIK